MHQFQLILYNHKPPALSSSLHVLKSQKGACSHCFTHHFYGISLSRVGHEIREQVSLLPIFHVASINTHEMLHIRNHITREPCMLRKGKTQHEKRGQNGMRYRITFCLAQPSNPAIVVPEHTKLYASSPK